jgi:hypothetical protein
MGIPTATPRAAAAWWLQAFDRNATQDTVAAIAEAIGANPDQPVGASGHPDSELKLARIAAFAAMAPGFQSC